MDPGKLKAGGLKRNMSMKTMLSTDIENLRKKYDALESSAQAKEDEYKNNLDKLEDTLKEATMQV